MIVCLCQGVSEKHIAAAIADGAQTRGEITARCGAGDGCGSCHRTIKLMIREFTMRAAPPGQVGLIAGEPRYSQVAP